jgi:hypothetical protein
VQHPRREPQSPATRLLVILEEVYIMRNARVLGTLVGIAIAMAVTVAGQREASACGGCVQPALPPSVTEVESVITDEQMMYAISKDQTTLYDEIEYSGKPADFAWILPIKGTVTVGLSADILFQTVNTLTATSVTSPPTHCPLPPTCGPSGPGCGASASGNATAGFARDADGGQGTGAVTVLSQKQVGPYETVQLHSTDGSALSTWLAAHKYVVPPADAPVIAAYVAAHFDFLALRLAPGEGVHAMQPVRVTSKGAGISLPLHMVAVGTGATTGITIYVVADGRWEPQNFPTFTISDSEIAWDWSTSSSNYETLRLSKEAAFKGRGWQIESSLELSQVTIRQSLFTSIQGDKAGVGAYPPVADAGAGDAGDASAAEGGVGEAGVAEAGVGEGGIDLDAGVPALLEPASQDLAVLFAGMSGTNVRITRMRSDVAHAALSEDMYLTASSDQGELSNQHIASQEVGQPLCPIYNDNCVQTGEVPRDQAVADANGGCTTTRLRSGSRTTLALLLAAVGFGVVRFRRRRR